MFSANAFFNMLLPTTIASRLILPYREANVNKIEHIFYLAVKKNTLQIAANLCLFFNCYAAHAYRFQVQHTLSPLIGYFGVVKNHESY